VRTRHRGWYRSVRWLVFIVVVGALVHVLVPLLAPLEYSLGVARSMPPLLVAAALVLQALSYAGSGFLLHSALRLVGSSISVALGSAITLAASSVSLVAGGTMGFALTSHRWVSARGSAPEAAVLAGWLPPLLNGFAQLVVATLSVSYLIVRGELAGAVLASLATVAVVLVLLLVAATSALREPTLAAKALDPAARLWAALRRKSYDPLWAREHLEVVGACKRAVASGGWRRPMLGSLMNLGADLGCLFTLFMAAGFVPPVGVLIVGWVIPQLARRITFVPGGIGIVEGGMAVFYEGLGVPSEVSVVVILLYRALSFWIPSVLGIPLAVYFERGATTVGADDAAR
jgi:uncharacterized membrane protein YbhN (UPF0104 family)